MRYNLLILILLSVVLPCKAIEKEATQFNSVNSSHLFTIGSRSTWDSYLSPSSYKGTNLGYLYDQMKLSEAHKHISYQSLFRIDLSKMENKAGNGEMWSGFLTYRWGAHYRWQIDPSLQILGGALMGGTIGGLYNIRNSNNPAQAKINLGLSLSGIALYKVRIGNYPIHFRYQINLPTVGFTFSPHYGQSYYEIFTLGNDKGVYLVSSPHNLFELENMFSAEIPFNCVTLRLGFSNTYLRSTIHQLETQINCNSFFIGFVKEGLFFSGKKRIKPAGYHSPVY